MTSSWVFVYFYSLNIHAAAQIAGQNTLTLSRSLFISLLLVSVLSTSMTNERLMEQIPHFTGDVGTFQSFSKTASDSKNKSPWTPSYGNITHTHVLLNFFLIIYIFNSLKQIIGSALFRMNGSFQLYYLWFHSGSTALETTEQRELICC